MSVEVRPVEAAARSRYSRVAIVLHWAIAALILYNLASGLLRPVLPRAFFAFHVSSGITILALSLVRVGWRLTHRPPPFLPLARWEARLAHGVHVALYAAMLLLPLSGWAIVSANPPAGSPGAIEAARHQAAPPAGSGTAPAKPGGGQEHRPRGPAMIWGVVRLPLIGPINDLGRTPAGVPGQRAVHDRVERAHLIGGWIMLALLVLHVAGALKHQIVDGEDELARIGLGRRGRGRAQSLRANGLT